MTHDLHRSIVALTIKGRTLRGLAITAVFSMFLLFSARPARAESDDGGGARRAADPSASAPAPAPTRISAPASMVPARGIDAALDVKGDDAMMRFAFPVKVPAWFLWQQVTDCQAYVRSIAEVKRCEYFVRDGKPAVLLEAVILGKTYTVVVGIERQFRRGHGKIKFESHNVAPTPATGALSVEPDGEGQARLSFEAKMPRDSSIPELLWKLGVAAVIHAGSARIQSTVESEYRAVKQNKELPPQLQLRSPAPPSLPPPPPALQPSPPLLQPSPLTPLPAPQTP